MKLDEADLEQSYFQTVRKGTDNAVGYILIGLVVASFFSLYLIGMQRVQTVSDQAVGDHEHQRSTSRPKPEISDSVDPASR